MYLVDKPFQIIKITEDWLKVWESISVLIIILFRHFKLNSSNKAKGFKFMQTSLYDILLFFNSRIIN